MTEATIGLVVRLEYPDGFVAHFRITEIVDDRYAPIFRRFQDEHGVPKWTEPSPKPAKPKLMRPVVVMSSEAA